MNDASHPNWSAITASAFPWEMEALEYLRAQFPTYEPYRAWSNFEFIADDGSVNEVDLLVFSPQGLFLIEIKSRPGIITGDARTWNWQQDGHTEVMDNPVLLANQKARKLASLLRRQRVFEKLPFPFIEPLVFCSAENLQCRLQGNSRFHVCLRDQGGRPGIMAAIMRRQCPGLAEKPRGTFNRPTGKAVARALEQVGIKPSHRSRRVGDYELQGIIDEGPGYQDFLGKHVALKDTLRRIRIYLAQGQTTPEQRAMIHRCAEREFRLLQALEHRGVLRAMEFTNHELGPAILFQHFPSAVRLDHFLIQRKDHLSDDLRLGLNAGLMTDPRIARGTIHCMGQLSCSPKTGNVRSKTATIERRWSRNAMIPWRRAPRMAVARAPRIVTIRMAESDTSIEPTRAR